jgi:hypothetical protein
MIVEGELFEYRNTSNSPLDVIYASVTALEVARFEISVDDEIIDVVYAGNGGSHSWWSQGGGKLIPSKYFPNGLPPNSTLRIRSNKKTAAIRVDWY